MDIFIIEQRIDQLESQKAKWLSVKKNIRGNNVKDINNSLSRLKRWKTDLIRTKNIKKLSKQCNKTAISFHKLSNSVKALKESAEHTMGAMLMFGSLSAVFQAVKVSDDKKRCKIG